ncbi:MAG TPA: TIGR03435 family protein, partial [Bryobacteraceae bacterium]|nr:TIGR03435 family protein [Bryobacteraceae bacterium]
YFLHGGGVRIVVLESFVAFARARAQKEGNMIRQLIAAGLLLGGSCLAQVPESKDAPDAAQPKFGMADVQVSKTSHFAVQSFGGVLRGGKYVNRDATMLALIKDAYGVSDDSIAGGPGWLSSDLFNIVAKVPDGTTQATAKLMLQALLADRFSLVVRHETRPVPRYVLTVDKGGPKFKPAGGSDDMGCKPIPQAGNGGGGRGPMDLASQPNIKAACHNVTSADIAENLRQMAGGYLDHDVIDSTKLDGTWDFDIEWTGRGALEAKGKDGISIFDAVNKQLGLKLELQQVPLPALAIVSVNRKPTENAPGVEAALAEAPPRFEAASVKPVDPDARPFRGLLYTGGSQIRSGGTLRELIAMSLQIPPNVAEDTLIGLPKSADSERWEITARLPAMGEGAVTTMGGRPTPPPLSIAMEMLHGVMIEQFGLKTHTENREITVYAMTNGGKPKMKPASDSERTACQPDPTLPKPATNMGPMIACTNTTMADLAANVEQMANAYIDHPVVDATGLEGAWDFAIGWTPKGALLGSTPNPNQQGPAAETADPSGGISFFDAIEKELGLKMVKEKRSFPVIVVDHVDEKPAE